MNTAIRNLTHLTLIVATAASAFIAQPSHAAGDDRQIVQLERVVITGKRVPPAATVAVVQLPRVVITGKRLPATTTVAAEKTQSVASVF